MRKDRPIILLAVLGLILAIGIAAGEDGDESIRLDESGSYLLIRGEHQDTVIIEQANIRYGGGRLKADSAIWIKGRAIILRHNVVIIDTAHQLYGDSVYYDLVNQQAFTTGERVILISDLDSVKAVGTNAFYSRDSTIFRMTDRPTLYLNYPDSSQMVTVISDRIAFESGSRIAYADGRVVINQMETEATSGRAILYGEDNILLLLNAPVARRRESTIRGDTLMMFTEGQLINRIYVQGNAAGDFKEPSHRDSTRSDVSTLEAAEIEFNFKDGQLDNIHAGGRAYSLYEPAITDSSEIVKNNVSGDTIKLILDNRQLDRIRVIGGAEGEYYIGRYRSDDSGRQFTEDTVYYRSDSIIYNPDDSVISLLSQAAVSNKSVSLSAGNINFNTASELVTAYDDTTRFDTSSSYVPVLLKDGEEEILGSYLEYSLATEKGMIHKSRSEYQDAYYRGRELYRQEKNIFFVKAGVYTSCDREQPHFHFYADNMKVIQGDRVVARSVSFYIEKIPLFWAPYYVFSIKSGRHSGFLPFRLGNFERGGRFIKNVGYYWAPSEYWDITASLDYNEGYGLTYNGAFRYSWLYRFSGSVSGSYSSESYYNNYNEIINRRWRIRFDHSQTFSPTFSMMANGHFISDKSYYTDYSTDQDDRLNRSLKSQVSLSKKLGSASLSAQFIHTDEIDREARTDQMPTASLSLPSRPIFGSPGKGPDGEIRSRWYHSIYSGYSVRLNNYSRRTTDTLGGRSRREYLTANHSTSLSAPFKLFTYIKINPSFSYQETWYKVFETDQSRAAEIDASTMYRRYAYSSSVNASTDFYGTVYPKVFGLEGFRHVLTPTVGFSWAPEITRHDNIRNYTGAGGGGAKRRSMNFSLRQLFQAKVKSGEEFKLLDLLSLSSSLSHNFEATGKKFSNLSTSAQSSLLKNISLTASWVHDLYEPNTEKLRWWSPYLQSFTLSTTFRTGGLLGQYEAPAEEDSSMFPGRRMSDRDGEKQQSWNLSVSHQYRESGRGTAFSKTHTVNFSLSTTITPNLSISYRQYYDIARHKTVSRSIEIHRKMHCWEGRFWWTIDGSNKGYQFRINVIAIPEIKFEKSESGIRDAFF